MTGSFEAGLYPVTWRDRWQARLCGSSGRRARLVSTPAAPLTGNAAQGSALVEGRISLGHSRAVLAEGRSLWAVPSPTAGFEAARQAFGWLDDLAALGTGPARQVAREWVAEWFTRQGHGKGPGWSLPLVSARLERLVVHAEWLTTGASGLNPARVERALARHRRFARRRIAMLPDGPKGLAVAARLVVAAARLDGSDALLAQAQDALDRACRVLVDRHGAVEDRSPETLARVFCHLAEAAQALADAGLGPHPEHARTLGRIAPVLRTLRHADGRLPRFHGGGAGNVARIDAALAGLRDLGGSVGARRHPAPFLPMGFARLSRGRVSVIVDVTAPPTSRGASGTSHAGTLGFEMTSGRSPLIVNCGGAGGFGPDWQDAARQTASHSTLVVGDRSSSKLERTRGGALVLTEAPGDVQVDLHPDLPDTHVVGAHNGYGPAFGLIHARRLDLSLAGDLLQGEDLLSAVSEADKRRFSQVAADGVPFALRFHLHPSVEAHLDPATGVVHLALPSREVWQFTHDGPCMIRLDPGVYLENTRPEPVASRQIVLSGRVTQPGLMLRWRLARDRTTPAFAQDGMATGDTETTTEGLPE